MRPLEGHKLELFLRVIHPTRRGLYFIGLFNVAGGGNIRMMDEQAEWITDLVTGELAPAFYRKQLGRERRQARMRRARQAAPAAQAGQ